MMPSLTIVAIVASTALTPCKLTPSGPLTITADNAIVELLSITSTVPGTAALTIQAKNITVRNVQIMHPAGGKGIYFESSDHIFITNVEVNATGNPSGANDCKFPYGDCDSIHGVNTLGVRIDGAVVTGGSTGIELSKCPGAHVSRLLSTNNRGPFPRGQCMQCSMSDGCLLEDFYCYNDNTSFTEDNINMWRSSNVTVRRGVVDGNNSPSGVGVMFEGSMPGVSGGLILDVDALHQGDGCFSGYPADGLRIVRTRCGWNHCEGWAGRGPPMSNSLMWAAGDEDGIQSRGIVVSQGAFYHSCNPSNVFWEASPGGFLNDAVDVYELGAAFIPRSPPEVELCWKL